MRNPDTHADTRAYCDREAPKAFAAHELTKRREWCWKVARPDSWSYGFFVLIAPGCVVLYGDIEGGVFRMSNGPEADVLAWAQRCASDQHYVMSKLQHRQFYPGDAIADVQARARRLTDDHAKKKMLTEAHDLLAAISQAEADGDLSSERFWRLCQEHDYYEMGSHMNWNSTAYWTAHALACFARLLKGDHAEAPVTSDV